MPYAKLTIFLMIAVLSMTAAPAFSADNLFDTKQATQHIEQGIAYLKANKIDSAIYEFDDAAAINPDAEAYYYLGYAYYIKSKKTDGDSRKKSLEYFEQAYEINPNFSPTRFKPAEQASQPSTTPSQAIEPTSPQAAAQSSPAPDQPKP